MIVFTIGFYVGRQIALDSYVSLQGNTPLLCPNGA